MPRSASGNGYSIAELERMLVSRRSKLSNLQRRRSQLMRRVDTLDAQIRQLGGATVGGSRAKNKSNLTDSIAQVLKKTTGPMQVTDIVQGVLHTGYRTKSANFRVIVNQALIRDKRFRKGSSRGTYYLKK